MRRFAGPTLLVSFTIAGFALLEVQAGEYVFEPTDQTFLNPERGLYGHAPLVQRTSFSELRTSGVSLVYAPIFLADFRERPISDGRLAEISDAFDRMRVAGLKAIVRVS